MIIVYLLSMVFLMGVMTYLLLDRRKLRVDLRYITTKLNSIIENDTDEQVKVVTDRVGLQRLLVEINHVLQTSHEVKAESERHKIVMKRMFSNVSHDLRTPLTVIIGYIETMTVAKDMSNEEQQMLLKTIHIKTNDLIQLINNFFDLAKLDSGDLVIPLELLMVNEICRQNILSFYDYIKEKNLQVEIEVPEEPLYCYINEEVMNRALDNLISNAIKYGLDGQIIGMKLTSDEENIYISIWDRGRGIEEKYHDTVFERLYTLENSRNNLYQGSGLGLTITKHLIETMGGHIHLESIPHEKTVFTVVLKRIIE